MINMDDSEDDHIERNNEKPEGNKKAKERMRLEGEAESLSDKMD